jgi:hypothetical protein
LDSIGEIREIATVARAQISEVRVQISEIHSLVINLSKSGGGRESAGKKSEVRSTDAV